MLLELNRILSIILKCIEANLSISLRRRLLPFIHQMPTELALGNEQLFRALAARICRGAERKK